MQKMPDADASTLFTPEATIGPFFPGIFVSQMPQDLCCIAPLLAHNPNGQRIMLAGRVLDSLGCSVPSAVLEFWQANAQGRYRGPCDQSSRPLDPQFEGFARLRSGEDGMFRLHTIKPGAHPVGNELGLMRAPHIRVTVFASGINRLVTQLFFEDEPLNRTDPVLSSIVDPAIRSRLVCCRSCVEDGGGTLAYNFNLVLRGQQETLFSMTSVDPTKECELIGTDGGRAHGRVLPVVMNDRESETRTPAQPLYRIPPAARDSFFAHIPPPHLRPGENDLTRIAPGRPQAAGQPIIITGRILDEDLRPVRRALIEVWNANTYGRYSHSLDSQNDSPLDPNFYGFGRLLSDQDGEYELLTIKPGAYIASAELQWWRPPHVHLSIIDGGIRLVTQMYFPEELLNQKDYIHLSIPEAERHRAIAKEFGSTPTFRFDIVGYLILGS